MIFQSILPSLQEVFWQLHSWIKLLVFLNLHLEKEATSPIDFSPAMNKISHLKLSKLWDILRIYMSVWFEQIQRQRLPRSLLPATELTAEIVTMAQRYSSMDDSFHLPNFPHNIFIYLGIRQPLFFLPKNEKITFFGYFCSTPMSNNN